jgi:hypothetical protein
MSERVSINMPAALRHFHGNRDALGCSGKGGNLSTQAWYAAK